MRKVPITRYGYRLLMRELVRLRHVVRPEVIEELQEARGFGVKTDNQQYLAARERHAVLQRKIRELEDRLANCEIFAGRKFFRKQVGFAVQARIENIETGEVHEYQLVGPYESDVNLGRLSVESPVGDALLGRFEGDLIVVETPSGVRTFRVLSISL